MSKGKINNAGKNLNENRQKIQNLVFDMSKSQLAYQNGENLKENIYRRNDDKLTQKPLIKIQSKNNGWFYTIILILLFVFAIITLYSVIIGIRERNIIEDIKAEWATVLVFPLILIFIFGIYFVINEFVDNGKSYIELYGDYFVIRTTKFWKVRRYVLPYEKYEFAIRSSINAFPYLYFVFFDKHKKPPFNRKAVCKINYSLFDTKIFDNVIIFSNIFQAQTKKSWEFKSQRNNNESK